MAWVRRRPERGCHHAFYVEVISLYALALALFTSVSCLGARLSDSGFWLARRKHRAPRLRTAAPSAPATADAAPPPSKPDKNAPSPETLSAIDAIGNRNVGCGRGAGNWYSLDKQVAMGQQYSQQIEHAAKLVSDPVVIEYVNRVGQNLVRNSDSKVPFTIKVIDTDEINAFALARRLLLRKLRSDSRRRQRG